MKKRVEALILKLHPPEVDLIQEEMKALGLEDDPNIGIYQRMMHERGCAEPLSKQGGLTTASDEESPIQK